MLGRIWLSREEAVRLKTYLASLQTHSRERLDLLAILQDKLHPMLVGRRVPLQASHGHPGGTISWEEHLEAHRAYCARHPGGMSAEDVAVSGFGYGEFIYFVGHSPTTFVPN